MKAMLVTLLSCLLFACGAPPQATTGSTRGLCPVDEVHLHVYQAGSLKAEYVVGLKRAATDWSEVTGMQQRVEVRQSGTRVDDPCVTTWEQGELADGLLGLTETGVVTLTERDLPTALQRQLPLHEMGHTLGLGDSKEMDSVMWPHIGPGQPITPSDKRAVLQVNGIVSL